MATTTLQPGQVTDLNHIRPFMLGGKATVTLVSKATGKHYIYEIKGQTPYPTEGEDQTAADAVWYADVLTGPDRYEPLAVITQRGSALRYFHARAARISEDAPSAAALKFAVQHFIIKPDARAFERLEVWHDGRCSRCHRQLKVPASIAAGLGPECATKV